MRHYTKEDIIRLVREEDAQFIRMQFTDIFGQLKNVAITASQIGRALDNQIMMDGSSIAGFVRIEESDQYLWPDLDTFAILPRVHAVLLQKAVGLRLAHEVYLHQHRLGPADQPLLLGTSLDMKPGSRGAACKDSLGQIQRGEELRPGGGDGQLDEVPVPAQLQIPGRGDDQHRGDAREVHGQHLRSHVPQPETADDDGSAQLPGGSDGFRAAEA